MRFSCPALDVVPSQSRCHRGLGPDLADARPQANPGSRHGEVPPRGESKSAAPPLPLQLPGGGKDHERPFAIPSFHQSAALRHCPPAPLLPGPWANLHVRPPLPLLRGKNGTALINLRKAENDALKVRSVKNSKSLLECPRSLRLLLPSTQKRSMTTELFKSYLAGGDRSINFHRQTNRNRHN